MILTFTVLAIVFIAYLSGINVAKAAYGQANGYADQALSAMKVV